MYESQAPEAASTPQAAPADDADDSAGRVHTLSILAVALVLRLLVLAVVVKNYPRDWLFSRGLEMGLMAKSIVLGQGLGSPFHGPTGPTAFFAPIYPLLVAGVFRIFGIYSPASAVAIIVAQIILNLVTIYLITRVALLLFDARTANVAGFFWAISLPLIWLPTIFWETCLTTSLLIGLILLAAHCKQYPPATLWIAMGAYCGFAGLVNPALLPSLFAVVLWSWFQTRKASGLFPILGLFIFAVVFAPWPIRNARIFHAFVPTRSTFGFELWMGNHPGSSGYLEEWLFPTFNQKELDDYNASGEIAYSANKSTLARQYILNYPGQFIRLSSQRFMRFWAGTGSRGGSIFFPLHALTTTLLSLPALWILFRQRRFSVLLLFILPLALFPLPYYITHAEFRFRLVIDPLLTILAAFAVTQFLQHSSKPRPAVHT
jgi:4-amino-4-deoxy-L-arabinose transferase-like glycosyltransferase